MNNTGNIVGYIDYIYQNTRNFRPARFVKEADYEVKERTLQSEIGKMAKLFNTVFDAYRSEDYQDVNKLLEDSVAVFKYIQVLETCVVDKKNLDYKAAKEKLVIKDLMKEYGVR